MLKLWLLLLIGSCGIVGVVQCLDTLYEWKYIDYLWDTEQQRQRYVESGQYAREAVIPIDVDRSKDGRVFVTLIGNVPATLTTVSKTPGPSGPLVQPYPDWSWYTRKDCSGITSVYRVAIDDCNRMYVLDNGYKGLNQTCPAQVLLFDLATNKLLNRLVVPDGVSHNAKGVGLLVTPVVEYSGPTCDLRNLFMADPTGAGLVLWNTQKFTRLEGRAFTPDPLATNVTIAGETFVLGDSLLGMTLSKVNLPDNGRELLFRPFASRSLYGADTRVLARSVYADTIRYAENKEFLPSQASTMATAENGAIFFGLTTEMAVACWNQYRNMTRSNLDIVVQDVDRLQFMSGMKVLPPSRANGVEELWLLSNRFQKIARSTMNFSEVNFRILKAPVKDLIRGSRCELPSDFVLPDFSKLKF